MRNRGMTDSCGPAKKSPGAGAASQENGASIPGRRRKGVSTDPVVPLPIELEKPGREGSPDSIEVVWREIADAPFDRPLEVAQRLKAFSDAQVLGIKRQTGRLAIGPWPPLSGCLAVLFASRSGSTYLARELECTFAIGRLREALNPPRILNRTPAQITETEEDTFFSFKAGAFGVIAAELCGFVDAYILHSYFILLIRRDIVAQAVSNAKSTQTGQWHSNQEQMKPPTYDHALIARYVNVIADNIERLQSYCKHIGRPCGTLFYEDFSNGDFRKAEALCDTFSVPRRGTNSGIRPIPVYRMGDALNESWAARFRAEMDASTRARIDRYLAEI
jgi:LPS sulfotransferase NodH